MMQGKQAKGIVNLLIILSQRDIISPAKAPQ